MSKSVRKQVHIPGAPRKVTPYKRQRSVLNDFEVTYVKINRDPKIFL